MRNQIYFLSLCLACLFISACVSKEKYDDLVATLADTQAKLEQKSTNVEKLKQKLGELENNWKKCRHDNSELHSRYKELENKQQMLSQTLAQKEDVIHQIDEAKHNLENKMKSQIKTHEQKIKELEDAITKLDETKRILEINLLAQLEIRERKIREQGKTISSLGNQKQHVETNLIDLKEQIAIREKTINEQMMIIAELDSTRLKIERNLQDRASDIELREKKIKELQDAIAQRDKTKRQIENDLKEQIKTQKVKLEKLVGKLKVTFVDRILFNSGSAKIKEEGKQLLLTLAESLEHNNQNIIVEGHTDNVLIGPELREKYPTNWELSVARSVAVVRYLIEKPGIEPQRFTASGYSFYKPVASNETEKDRGRNRRIEIILASQR
jgi:chemotaxis protein MotB